MAKEKFHLICEKDVGLFSLIQQVISHIPLAISENRVPVVLFGERCCYWTPNGYNGRSNVWEYYFEPIIKGVSSAEIPGEIISYISSNPPFFESPGYELNQEAFVSNHFGDHPDFKGKSLRIPYKWDDPGIEVRKIASPIIEKYIRPRAYLVKKANQFAQLYMSNLFMIGVHIRASDISDVKSQYNIERRYAYQAGAYIKVIENLIQEHPQARVFVATDSQDALDVVSTYFPRKVMSYSTIFHTTGPKSGKGAMGWFIPGYLADDPRKAAQNGEEAVIDYLLLSKCDYLVHNGSGLPRTVLLGNPNLAHTNIHSKKKYLRKLFSFTNLEFYYFSMIMLKKVWWKFNGLRRRIANLKKV